MKLEQCATCGQLTDWNKPIGKGYESLLCLDCFYVWNRIQQVMLKEETEENKDLFTVSKEHNHCLSCISKDEKINANDRHKILTHFVDKHVCEFCKK